MPDQKILVEKFFTFNTIIIVHLNLFITVGYFTCLCICNY